MQTSHMEISKKKEQFSPAQLTCSSTKYKYIYKYLSYIARSRGPNAGDS